MNIKDFGALYRFGPSDYLGGGAFGRVYSATDSALGRKVALKFFKRQGSEKYTLIDEMKRAVEFAHPNICRYHAAFVLEGTNDLGEPEETQVGVMELAEGGQIDRYLQSHPQFRRKLLVDVLRGLSYLHAEKIVHRDLKPANVLVSVKQTLPVAKIADFGVSRSAHIGSSGVSIVGTFDYMAPEQIFPAHYGVTDSVPTNIDLWSFGVMVYELLTGTMPFGGEGPQVSGSRIVEDILSGIPDDVFVQFPEPYQTVLRRCIVLQASERVRTADELIPLLDVPEADNAPQRVFVRWDREKPRGRVTEPDVQEISLKKRATEPIRPEVRRLKEAFPESEEEVEVEPKRRWWLGAVALIVAIAGIAIPVLRHPAAAANPVVPGPPAVASLGVSCNVGCTWTLNGMPASVGSDGRISLKAGEPATIEARPTRGRAKAQERTVTPSAGQRLDMQFQFAVGPEPPNNLPVSPNPADIDALLQTGYDKEFSDHLPEAFADYERAEKLSTQAHNYRLQDARKGMKDVSDSCRDRGMSCGGKL